MKLTPFISETIWGGCRLAEEYGIDPQGRANCAEAWVLSAHRNGSSIIQNGAFSGKPLAAVFPDFPLLVKLIDAKETLSLQVHPRDSDALAPGEAGKTECWYVLDAQPDAFLYLGFRRAVTRAEFAQAIAAQTLLDYVQPFAVRPGEFYFIPAGTLHAIGRGVLLAEVQQSSDTTYRVYDYGRLQNGAPRQLHTQQALAVTDRTPYRPQGQSRETNGRRPLVSCEYFTVEEWRGQCFRGCAKAHFVSLLALPGTDAKLLCAGEALPLRTGESVLLPAGAGGFQLQGSCRMLVTMNH
jgi:mannose-6-phosphate isomerase